MSMGLARGGGLLFPSRHVVGLIMSKLGIGSNLVSESYLEGGE